MTRILDGRQATGGDTVAPPAIDIKGPYRPYHFRSVSTTRHKKAKSSGVVINKRKVEFLADYVKSYHYHHHHHHHRDFFSVV